MSIIKQSILFTVFLIIFGFIFRYYSVYKSGVDIHILAIVLSVAVAGIMGGVGFYFGLHKVNGILLPVHLALSAIFVFFMSHNLSNLFDLYQISWLAYTALLFAVAFYTGLRGPRIFKKNKPKPVDSEPS